MADRKQFPSIPKTKPELATLLSKIQPATNDELREQRISFAFGNAPESELITKDSMRKASKNIRISD